MPQVEGESKAAEGGAALPASALPESGALPKEAEKTAASEAAGADEEAAELEAATQRAEDAEDEKLGDEEHESRGNAPRRGAGELRLHVDVAVAEEAAAVASPSAVSEAADSQPPTPSDADAPTLDLSGSVSAALRLEAAQANASAEASPTASEAVGGDTARTRSDDAASVPPSPNTASQQPTHDEQETPSDSVTRAARESGTRSDKSGGADRRSLDKKKSEEKEDDDGTREEEEDDGEDDADDGDTDAHGLRQMIREAREEQLALTRANEAVQEQIAVLWTRHPQLAGQVGEDQRAPRSPQSPASAGSPNAAAGANALSSAANAIDVSATDVGRSLLAKYVSEGNSLLDQIQGQRERDEARVDRLSQKLDSLDEKATELHDSFRQFKREVARGAEFSRTGKPIKLKRILAFEAAEEEKDREIENVRLKNIHYQQQLEALEREVKAKEELEDGLHLIDFEQLKIENQTLNEKIEERNDELHKLRKKTTTTVQVLTHIKEKLTFVRTENQACREEVRRLDEQVTALRDALTRAKHQRERLRAENATLKQRQGFVGSDLLVADFERKKQLIAKTEAELALLRAKYASLMATANGLAAAAAADGR
jgi:hypothetical protein